MRMASGPARTKDQMDTLRASTIAVVSSLVFGALAAKADDCALATAAAIAQAKVPHASTHVTTVPGEASIRAEMIFTTDKAYLQTNGAWRSMAYSPEAHVNQINAAKKRAEQAKQTCEKAGSVMINDEATTILTMHTDAEGHKSDARLWISDKTGLLMRSEIRIDGGDSVAIVTDDFRYDDIKAPPDVN